MQLIDLYDYLDISLKESSDNVILLSGTSDEIPYNEKNLVYKAAELFIKNTGISGYEISVHITKNIPVAAGLAGGSTDAAGMLYGLNKLFNTPLNQKQLENLCAQLGSDLNVCLNGGCLLATSRGENTKKLPAVQMPVTLIKPKNLGISAKEAYTKYSLKKNKPQNNMTEKMIDTLEKGENIKEFLYND